MSAKIRVMGTRQECAVIAAALKEVFAVRSVSGWYANRGDTYEGRIYVEIDRLGRHILP